jgi:hypothetical protein
MSRRNSGYFVSHPVSFFNHRSHIIEAFSAEVKGESAKKSKYAGRAGMARRHPGPVDKGRLLRPTCAKN